MSRLDSEIEYDRESLEEYLIEDELDIIEPRCVSQSANILLGKSKGGKGRCSNRQLREEMAKEKGIVSVFDFMRKAKGVGISLGQK